MATRTMMSLKQYHVDECGEVNCTTLAEETCKILDWYEGEDSEIPEELFDIAVEVSNEK
jgi:hypothetical protein